VLAVLVAEFLMRVFPEIWFDRAGNHGTGGMAMGLRTIPEIVKIAQAVVDHANTGAWLINLSNPSGMLTEAIYRYTNCRAVGLCNWPRSFWTRMMEAYKVERNDVFLEWQD
jgi:6-phospho-beta-glucosidase